MKDVLLNYWNDRPLASVVILGFLVRLIAAIFSTGYAMHDDHFLLIESAGSWIDGYDYNDWINVGKPGQIPTGHSFFYAGIQFGIFWLLELVGITSPSAQMFVTRLIHGLYSLLIITLSYRITAHISNVKTAKQVGLLLALLWIVPMFSVRNLVEVVCVPPLLYVVWVLLKNEGQYKWHHFVLAGLVSSTAVAVRIQTSFFLLGVGLVLLYRKEIWGALLLTMAFVVGYFITQLYDLWNWGYPFAEVKEYINYNIIHSTAQGKRPWYNYLLLILGVLIPPVSVFLGLGFFKNWKRNLMVFLPTLLFIAFHSYFPNKQERFIFPAFPFVAILGMAGWQELKNNSFWSTKQKFVKGSWVFFFVINALLLVFFTPSQHKRARVGAMEYLAQQPDFVNFILEASNTHNPIQLPQYYSQHWEDYAVIDNETDYAVFKDSIATLPANLKPNYVLFMESDGLEARTHKFENEFGPMELKTIIEPSFYDKIIYKMNKVNRNEPCYIYKLK